MKFDYQSFYNLQAELRNNKTKYYVKLRIKDTTIDDISYFCYLAEQKQLRYLTHQGFGEKRLYNIELDDIEVIKFFLIS